MGHSIKNLCSVHSVEILQEQDVVGTGMGRKKVWLPTGNVLPCRVVAQNSLELLALMQEQNRTYYNVYFSAKPPLSGLIHRLLWNGLVLRLIGNVKPCGS